MPDLEINPSLQADTRLYRYISLESFLTLLEMHHTHLKRITEWDDPWEAILPRIPVVDASNKPRERSYSYHESVFGQCWSLLSESDAMWRIYSPTTTGLVISTTLKKFGLIRGCDRLYVGRIIYFEDLDDLVEKAQGLDHPFQRLCFKRSAYNHEQEVRLLVDERSVDDCVLQANDLTLPIDPSGFVERIVIDPRAPAWFVATVKKYCERVGFSGEPTQSDLYAPDPHLTCGLVTKYQPIE